MEQVHKNKNLPKASLDSKLEAFQNLSKTWPAWQSPWQTLVCVCVQLRWISSLGKDVMASKVCGPEPSQVLLPMDKGPVCYSKERLNSLDAIAEQHSTSLLAHEA